MKRITDKQRLDFLEAQGNGQPWVARKSDTGRGYRLHNMSGEPFKPIINGGSGQTVREAIDMAIRQFPLGTSASGEQQAQRNKQKKA